MSPAGNTPETTDHAYGGVPPDAAIVAEYATPTVPAVSAPAEITTGGMNAASVTETLRCTLAPLEPIARTTYEKERCV